MDETLAHPNYRQMKTVTDRVKLKKHHKYKLTACSFVKSEATVIVSSYGGVQKACGLSDESCIGRSIAVLKMGLA